MISIKIDIGDIAGEFKLGILQTEDMMDHVVKELTAKLAYHWDAQAKIKLKGSRKEYRNSLLVVDKGRFRGAVVLKGVVPNMIEQGANPFDMKPGFRRSEKAKLKRGGGWYLTIPFRLATPFALAESSVFTGVLPESVYNVIKEKEKTASTAKLEEFEVPEQHKVPRTRAAIIIKSRLFEEYKNKTSIYAGLTRTDKTYEKTKHGTYTTFRRVSDESEEGAFIHTGITARNLAEKAVEAMNIPAEVDRITDKYLASIGF